MNRIYVAFTMFVLPFLAISQPSNQSISTKQVNSKTLFSNQYFELSDTTINTEFDEIGTVFFKNKYIVLSNQRIRFSKTPFDKKNNLIYKNLYCVDVESNGDLNFPLMFSKAIDSKLNEGNIAISNDETTIYFTRSKKHNPNEFQLYVANLDKKSRKHWSDIELAVETPKGVSIETPFIESSGEYLYFSSNKPGGHGGFDIYKAKILSNGKLGDWINLGENINSSKDEKYPFISNDNSIYFSSNNNPTNQYDVYISNLNPKNTSFTSALKLGHPINSDSNDIAFILAEDQKGYISTDRNAEKNFDILSFKYIKAMAKKLLIIDQKTEKPISHVTIDLIDTKGMTIQSVSSDTNGHFTLSLLPNQNYTLKLNKEGYYQTSKQFNSNDNPDEIELTLKQKLNQNELAKKLTIDKDQLSSTKRVVYDSDSKEFRTVDLNLEKLSNAEYEKIKNANNNLDSFKDIKGVVIDKKTLLFDHDQSKITLENKQVLAQLIKLLKSDSSYRLIIEAHTDSRGTVQYNNKLSERRLSSTLSQFFSAKINPSNVMAVYYGESKPLIDCEPNCDEIANRKNRRVDIKIIK